MYISSSLDDLFEEDETLEEITKIASDRVSKYKYITESSGNVFADLNLPDAEERLTKSRITSKIYKLCRNKKLSDLDSCILLDISEDKLTDLLHGRLSLFTIEDLNKYWIKLNEDY